MKRMGLLPLVIWMAVAGCGAPDRGTDDKAGSGPAFSARGTAASADARQIEDLPELTAGVSGLAGSFALQTARFESSDPSCRVETEPTVIIPYTVDTRFQPPEIRQALLGRQLSVSGVLLRDGDRCVPVAREVGEEPGGGTTEPPATNAVSPPPPVDPRPAPAPRAPLPSPQERPGLPPMAPEVLTTFRPSLPDPPTSAP